MEILLQQVSSEFFGTASAGAIDFCLAHREQQTRLQADIEKAVGDIDALNERLKFARKTAHWRGAGPQQ
jgi:hypothetical protein